MTNTTSQSAVQVFKFEERVSPRDVMRLLYRLFLVFALLARSAVSITTDPDLATASKLASFDPSRRTKSVASSGPGKRFLRVRGEINTKVGCFADVVPKNGEERGGLVDMVTNAAAMKIKMNKELTLRMPPQSYQQLKMLSKTDDNYKYFVQYYFKYYVKYPSKIPSNLPATAYDEIMKARMYDWLHVKNLSPPQVVKELERTGVAESNAYYIARYYKMWSEEQQRLSKADTDFFLKKYVWKN